MKSEDEEVDPSLKQTQDEETGATAQSKDNLSPIVELKRIPPTSGGVDTPQQATSTLLMKRQGLLPLPLSCSGKLKTLLQQMSPKLHLVKQPILKVQA